LSNRYCLTASGYRYLSLGPIFNCDPAKTDRLVENYRYDEGTVTLQPSMLNQVVPLADCAYRWKKRSIKGDRLTALTHSMVGCSNGM